MESQGKKWPGQEKMIFKEFGFIGDYSRWADTIHEGILRFFALYKVHPNILLASGATFDKIDNYLKRYPVNLVFSGEGDPPPFDGLSSFVDENYEIEFCLDADQGENYFILVYDETPDFDGENIPESTGEEPKFSFRMAG
jgi:hypothetical protein